ncbi:Aldehyde/histidinol dehydrogenase [Cytidiella melzeri]|nr:Aldehyde/histidinol dehydrogenase [Cytidiella melzeri]
MYIQAIQTGAEVAALLELDRYIDLVIPRGSDSLVHNIQNNTRIPVMGHTDGLCAVYLDKAANENRAVRVAVDSKVDFPAACNAAKTLIVHETLLNTIWPDVAKALITASVQLRCDTSTLSALTSTGITSQIQSSTPDDDETEHLSLTLSVLSVLSLSAALSHINSHTSHYTDCIVTEDEQAALIFCRGTFVNVSTSFADVFRYGFGTEVGISTGRIYARDQSASKDLSCASTC